MSVVIPVYNGQRFLGDAIRSVLAQTYRPVECIVVDDGSTDESVAVARSFGPVVEVVTQANRGVASARNAGVAASRGELVAFLDADDYWRPTKLEVQVGCWLARPWAGMVFCGFEVVKGERRHPHSRILATAPGPRIRSATLLEGYGIGFGITSLLNRSALEQVGQFDERLSLSADVAYVRRLLQRFEVLAVPEPLAVYRLHGRGQMHGDLTALEHDWTIVTDEAFPAGTMEHRRSTANLHTRLAVRRLLRGQVARAAHHGRVVWANEPARLLRLPASALARRVLCRVWGRWPVIRPHDPVLVASPISDPDLRPPSAGAGVPLP